jgi:RNA polymerase sigma-70 factor (ECF subfamily)
MVGDRSEAEDLTQDAFLQLFRKLHTFRGESAFRTWLFRLVTNVALMHLRKKKRLMMQESPLEENHTVREEGDAPRRALGATDHTLAGANDRVILERAIQGLAPGYRRVFLLHDLEGYIHTEISAILGLGIGTSKSQLHKARRHLRRLLRTARR